MQKTLRFIKKILETNHLYPSKVFLAERKKRKDYKYLISKGVETERDYTVLHGLPFISKSPNSHIIINKGVTLVSDPKINPSGILHPCTLVTQSSEAQICIGKDSGMSGATICCMKRITIGEYVGLGSNVSIFDHDFHPINPFYRKFHNEDYIECKEVTIEDFAWIGANSIILKGVHIGKGAVVGAGSVVTNDVPPLTVYAGNPAKFVKKITITKEQYEALFNKSQAEKQ